ncbi:hypothetical protein ACQEVC_34450 [Plantactinospora sp. CA-294935]|uniref:hypothetical protein n=1 Tax=Plantactinospora sp. CA-294935 TaxID=3240012 RepID=UPI003D8ADD53
MTADVGLEETEADRAYEAKPDCCVDCDEMLAEAGDLSEFEQEAAERGRRVRAALAEVARWAARVLEELGRVIRVATKALGDLFRQLLPAWRRAAAWARSVTEARRVRLRALHVDHRRRLRHRRRRER